MLGEGTFGKVYKIKREFLGRKQYAALKVIRIFQNKTSGGFSFSMDDRSFVDEIVSVIELMAKFKGITEITADSETGDVVLFEVLPSKFLLHRVTDVSEKDFETAGDFNSFRDGRFPGNCVIGKAIKFIRKDKCYESDSFFIKFYSALWMLLYPFRKPMVKLLMLISRIK